MNEVFLFASTFLVLIFWSITTIGMCTLGKVENETSYKIAMIAHIVLLFALIAWMYYFN